MTSETGTGQEQVERGAAEDNAGAPLTQTEIDASRRPPSAPGNGPQATSDDDGDGASGDTGSAE